MVPIRPPRSALHWRPSPFAPSGVASQPNQLYNLLPATSRLPMNAVFRRSYQTERCSSTLPGLFLFVHSLWFKCHRSYLASSCMLINFTIYRTTSQLWFANERRLLRSFQVLSLRSFKVRERYDLRVCSGYLR